ncbi:MAG: hypothetical protein J6S53_01510 [Lentisphaeria bacterium]|nr:hypothetical protein [Lentisphaeria bacterium]
MKKTDFSFIKAMIGSYKSFLSVLFFFLFSFSVLSGQEENLPAEKKETKTNSWRNNFRGARKTALQEKKFLLLFFTVSDASSGNHFHLIPRYKYNKNFIKKAAKDHILVHIDLPKDKYSLSRAHRKQNEQLCSRFSVTHYPTFLLLDPRTPWGNMLCRRTGSFSPDELLDDMEKRASAHYKRIRKEREKMLSSEKELKK